MDSCGIPSEQSKSVNKIQAGGMKKGYLKVSKERVHEQVEHNERHENSIQYPHKYETSA